MNKQEAKKQIEKLIKKYESLSPAQLRKYNESMTCKDFILPLFEILGWDVYNRKSYNEVTSETQVSGKRVDYAFHSGGIIKFFVEAKKINVDLREEKWGEQAIYYAWHKSVPWTILTDFESIKVFNAEWDEVVVERSLIFEIPHKDYLTDDRLWYLTKESFEKVELDKYAEENFKKPKREPVDKQLAKDLVRWRTILFDNLKAWNSDKSFNNRQFAEGAQILLNRLIFIRTTEDRGFEGQRLRELIRNYQENKSKIELIGELKKIFRDYNNWYDSKLFEEHICDTLEYENSFLADVISELYRNKKGMRYDFASINADVLGSIYEQYLGQIQQKEEKSKRKSQGIYYTPRYIVDYIIKNTLGELLKGKSAYEASKIKITDPACGSGSFLIRAFDLLDDHIKRERNQSGINSSINYARKIGVLTSNIYGIDLDKEAVEIAQLNLLLKVLEMRSQLPNLLNNIKCGNSLLSGTPKELEKKFGKKWQDKKPFNWREKFSEVFKQGGFDVVIGNPPYIKEFVDKSAFDGLHDSPYYQGKMDIWTLFACQAIDHLKDGGYFSFIAPNNWLTNAGASIFRNKILKEGKIISFIDFGDFKVFKEAGIQTMVFVFKKEKPKKSYQTTYAKITNKNISEDAVDLLLQSNLKASDGGIIKFGATLNPQQLMGKNIIFSDQTNDDILSKIEAKKNFKLTEKEVANGIHPHYDFVNKAISVKHGNKFKIGEGIFGLTSKEKEDLHLTKEEKSLIKPYFTTEQLGRYYANPNNTCWIIYTDSKFKNPKEMKPYPNIKTHLDRFRGVITSDNKPYGLHRARDEKFFLKEKIIVQRKCPNRPVFTYTNFDCYVSATFYIIKTERLNQKYLTGLLNSGLIKYWLKNKGKMQGSNFQIDKEPLMNIPLIKSQEKTEQEIASFVDKMMRLTKELHELDSVLDKEEYMEKQKEIRKIDDKLDEKVYTIYGLSEKEIKIIEDSLGLK